MIYECAISKETGEFVLARKSGHAWAPGEIIGFHIIEIELEPELIDRDVEISFRGGSVTTKLSSISPNLVRTRFVGKEKFVI